jgi:polyhydroxyalkanoate synthesis regulator protein
MLAAVTAHNGRPMVPASDPVKIRLTAQRRFFQPRTGSYVTFDDLLALVRRRMCVAIDDAHTGADVTSFCFSQTRTEH